MSLLPDFIADRYPDREGDGFDFGDLLAGGFGDPVDSDAPRPGPIADKPTRPGVLPLAAMAVGAGAIWLLARFKVISL